MWIQASLNETERARALYELAIAQVGFVAGLSFLLAWLLFSLFPIFSLLCLTLFSGWYQPVLDMPEVLWKAYIDFEIKQVCFLLISISFLSIFSLIVLF